jgi:hypothetical protein
MRIGGSSGLVTGADRGLGRVHPRGVPSPLTCGFLVGKAGFEPAASASRTLRANQAALLPGVGDGIRRRRDEDRVRPVGLVEVGTAAEERPRSAA